MLLRHLCGVGTVLLEDSRWRKLPELVTHHVFGHEHAREHLAVVDGEGLAHELRQDHAAARPGLDRTLRPAGGQRGHLLQQVGFHIRTFFD